MQSAFWRPKPGVELYDTEADPDELHNLAGDVDCVDIEQRLSEALDEHILAVHDNGWWAAKGTDDWRDWIGATARGFRAALLAQPALALYFRLTATEELLGVLQRAGFDEQQAGRVLNLIAQIVFICVKDEL